MTALAPDLFQRRFKDLVDMGRARLPSLAPDWTDHNAHDPGITLMELLAWVAEAQLYSLSRLRRDERVAYAALLGIAGAGTRGARGLIWRDRQDARSPAATFAESVVLSADAVVNVVGAETPTFRPTGKLLWVPGRLTKLEARGPGGHTRDHTAVNERGGAAFPPFGESAGRRDVLALTFRCRGEAGLFGARRQDAKGARWAVGIRAALPGGGAATEGAAPRRGGRSPLAATMVAGDERVPLNIVSDSTDGMLTTGALLLDLDAVTGSPQELTIEFTSPDGFARPPRVVQIEPNVLPVEQGRSISRELHLANGMPDWSFELDAPGLRFAAGEEPLALEVAEAAGLNAWERRDRVIDHGPDEGVYELDASAGRVTFGNGVDGRIPARDAQVLVSYSVSDGDQGNVARNRTWKVAGFEGAFGVNPDPVTGGAAPPGWIDQRREARRRTREEHALASSADVVAAARGLPLLEVARAWVPLPPDSAPRAGVVTLVAMRSRPSGEEPESVPETQRWLEAIRRRLAPRMPLGTRLVVAAPRYVAFSIDATLEAQPGRYPAKVREGVIAALRERLALVSSGEAMPPRRPGVPVTRRDVTAWMRAVDGVRRVVELRLLGRGRRAVDEIAVPRSGLPRCDVGASNIEVKRATPGSRP